MSDCGGRASIFETCARISSPPEFHTHTHGTTQGARHRARANNARCSNDKRQTIRTEGVDTTETDGARRRQPNEREERAAARHVRRCCSAAARQGGRSDFPRPSAVSARRRRKKNQGHEPDCGSKGKEKQRKKTGNEERRRFVVSAIRFSPVPRSGRAVLRTMWSEERRTSVPRAARARAQKRPLV